MKQLVYIDKSQLDNFPNSLDTEPLRGVGYEWPGEGVIHAYLDAPRFKIQGKPIDVFFICINTPDNVIDTYSFAGIMENKISEIDIKMHKPFLTVFVFRNTIEAHIKAFFKNDTILEECDVLNIPGKEELYSRSKGLLESNALADKNILIIGLGSFGSHIAVELAKAGIGNFSLVDFDRLELSNVSRHVCGVNELGRYKTCAVKDAILLKNPYANVATIEADINKAPEQLKQLIEAADITICVTDNNRSRFNINTIALQLNKVILFGRAITRAEGGDVFKLNGNIGPCYNCLVGDNAMVHAFGEEEISSRKQADATLPAYTTAEDKDAVVQVGLSSDISPICNMMVKLALVELSKNTSSEILSLENELTYNYYLWANRRERQYLNWGLFNNPENKPTILRWYGVKVAKKTSCFSCTSNYGNE